MNLKSKIKDLEVAIDKLEQISFLSTDILYLLTQEMPDECDTVMELYLQIEDVKEKVNKKLADYKVE